SYACLADWIRWAGKTESAIRVLGVTREKDVARISLLNRGDPVAVKVRAISRDRRWEVISEGESQMTLPSGNGRYDVKLKEEAPGGISVVEVYVTQTSPDAPAKTLAFGSAGVVA